MNKDPFEIISNYCKDNDKDSSVRNYAYCIYKTNALNALKDFTKNHASEPSSDDIKAINAALLSDGAIGDWLFRAETMLREAEEELLKPYIKSFNFKEFLISVAASITGAFWYSILLLIIFKLASDQIASWLISLTAESAK